MWTPLSSATARRPSSWLASSRRHSSVERFWMLFGSLTSASFHPSPVRASPLRNNEYRIFGVPDEGDGNRADKMVERVHHAADHDDDTCVVTVVKADLVGGG